MSGNRQVPAENDGYGHSVSYSSNCGSLSLRLLLKKLGCVLTLIFELGKFLFSGLEPALIGGLLPDPFARMEFENVKIELANKPFYHHLSREDAHAVLLEHGSQESFLIRDSLSRQCFMVVHASGEFALVGPPRGPFRFPNSVTFVPIPIDERYDNDFVNPRPRFPDAFPNLDALVEFLELIRPKIRLEDGSEIRIIYFCPPPLVIAVYKNDITEARAILESGEQGIGKVKSNEPGSPTALVVSCVDSCAVLMH